MTFEEKLSHFLEKAQERKRVISELRSSSSYYREEVTKSINRKIKEMGDSEEAIRRILVEIPELVADCVDSIKIAAIRSHESCETLSAVIKEYKNHRDEEDLKLKKAKSSEKKREEKEKIKKPKRNTVKGGTIREIGEKPQDGLRNRRKNN